MERRVHHGLHALAREDFRDGGVGERRGQIDDDADAFAERQRRRMPVEQHDPAHLIVLVESAQEARAGNSVHPRDRDDARASPAACTLTAHPRDLNRRWCARQARSVVSRVEGRATGAEEASLDHRCGRVRHPVSHEGRIS